MNTENKSFINYVSKKFVCGSLFHMTRLQIVHWKERRKNGTSYNHRWLYAIWIIQEISNWKEKNSKIQNSSREIHQNNIFDCLWLYILYASETFLPLCEVVQCTRAPASQNHLLKFALGWEKRRAKKNQQTTGEKN